MTDICGRLAPSPTGALHLGNARSFLLAWLSARSRGGKVVLRIEDLDHPKVKKYATDQALEDLRWLGLDWDEGPDTGGPHAPYVQSERSHLYREALETLVDKELLFLCTCTRKDVETARSAPHKEDHINLYPGTCRGKFSSYEEALSTLPEGRRPAWRFKVPDTEMKITDGFLGEMTHNPARESGDFVLARDADGAGYQLAVVVDDAEMGVTEVLRGDDLSHCSFWQKLIYDSLGLPCPEFVHVPLVCGPDGYRLAKRHGDTRIALVRERGTSADTLVGLLGYWSGLAEFGEKLTATDLLDRYSLKKIPQKPVFITKQELKFLGL